MTNIAIAVGVVLLLAVVSVLAISLHEMGHAAAARALGVPVRRVEIGRRGPAKALRVAGILVVVHPFPISGRTLHGPVATARQQATVAAAGPVANLIVGGLFVLGPVLATGPTAVALGAFAAMNLLLGIGNLAPIPGDPPRRMPSDGLVLCGLVVDRRRQRHGRGHRPPPTPA